MLITYDGQAQHRDMLDNKGEGCCEMVSIAYELGQVTWNHKLSLIRLMVFCYSIVYSLLFR